MPAGPRHLLVFLPLLRPLLFPESQGSVPGHLLFTWVTWFKSWLQILSPNFTDDSRISSSRPDSFSDSLTNIPNSLLNSPGGFPPALLTHQLPPPLQTCCFSPVPHSRKHRHAILRFKTSEPSHPLAPFLPTHPPALSLCPVLPTNWLPPSAGSTANPRNLLLSPQARCGCSFSFASLSPGLVE